MGQNRTDTASQLDAKRRGAERRKCPACQRKNALSKFRDPDDGCTYRWCRYCDWAKSTFVGW